MPLITAYIGQQPTSTQEPQMKQVTSTEIARMRAGYHAMNGNGSDAFPQYAAHNVYCKWLSIARYSQVANATIEGILCIIAGIPLSACDNVANTPTLKTMRRSLEQALAAMRAVSA